MTILYLVFVLLVEYLAPVECLDEPCNSEGLDNTILGWSTDYYIAFWFFVLPLHILCGNSTNEATEATKKYNRTVKRNAAAAFISMGIAYILGGLGHSVYTNSGFDDNAGQQGFYITWAVAFTFMTLSVERTYRLVRHVALPVTTICCNIALFLTVSFWLVVCAWIVTAAGYIWCATENDLHVDNTIDDVPPFGDEDDNATPQQCLQLAAIGEITWYVCFAIFWIPAGISLRTSVIQKQQSANDSSSSPRTLLVYGFPASWAAIMVSIIPWTFGIMLIVYAGVAATVLDVDATEVYGTIYGAVIYHYGMLLGYYLFHNIAYALLTETTSNSTPTNDTTSPTTAGSFKKNTSSFKYDDEESC
jgi:hypothetical protein